MASNGKKRTTMAKLNRESKLREKRADKQARKDARKRAAAEPAPDTAEMLTGDDGSVEDELLAPADPAT
jgi:hypothetical protein